MRPIERITAALDQRGLSHRQNGSGLLAQCPAHEDRNPSLSITEEKDRVLLMCFAGCDFGEIMEALGLELKDAFEQSTEPKKTAKKRAKPKAELPSEEQLEKWQALLLGDDGLLEQLAAERAWGREALRKLGIGRIAGDTLTLSIPNRSESGELIGLIKYRPNPPAGEFASSKVQAAPGSKRELLPHPSMLEGSGPIFLLEGEADAITACSLGLDGIGIPGAKSWRREWAEQLAGREIVIAPDCDEPGEKLAKKATADLLAEGCSVKILNFTQEVSDPPAGFDFGDYARMKLKDSSDPEADLEFLGRSIREWASGLKPEVADKEPEASEEKKPEPKGELRPAADLLDQVEATLKRFIILPGEAEFDALALWVLHTHSFAGSSQTPYILLTSAEKRCGKSRVLEVLEPMVRQPWATADTSPAALFRKIEKHRPTLLLDELDALLGGSAERTEAIRGIINAGNRASGKVTRCVGQDQEVRDFSVFSPKVLAGIETQKIPDTIRDRSITISIKRRTPSEKVEKLFLDEIADELAPLRADLEVWAEQAIPEIKRARPEAPEELHDRAEEAWRPLLAIADLAGAAWPDRARRAARVLSTGDQDEGETFAARILLEIRELLGDELAISSSEILEHLNKSEDLPFGGWRDGRGLDARTLARLLKPYGIRSKKIRAKGEIARGFHLDQLSDAFDRWLPRHTPGNAEHAEHAEHGTDTEQKTPHEKRDVPLVPLVPLLTDQGADPEHHPEQTLEDPEQGAGS